jgi:hypothetical protein
MNPGQLEKDALRATVVGVHGPGSGRSTTAVPRGIEVLVKKAAVDEAFRQLLLTQRGAAAAAIGLELDPAEAAILSTIPEEHLARIIRQTVVPTEQRRVFLGQVAAAMLAAVGVGLASCGRNEPSNAAPGAPSTVPPGPRPPVAGAEPALIAGLPATRTQPAPATSTAPATTSTRQGYGSMPSGFAGGGMGPARN